MTSSPWAKISLGTIAGLIVGFSGGKVTTATTAATGVLAYPYVIEDTAKAVVARDANDVEGMKAAITDLESAVAAVEGGRKSLDDAIRKKKPAPAAP